MSALGGLPESFRLRAVEGVGLRVQGSETCGA